MHESLLQITFVKRTKKKTAAHVQAVFHPLTNRARRCLRLHDADQRFDHREQKHPNDSIEVFTSITK